MESNNIYNNLLDDDNESSNDEEMIFQMDFNESDESKIIDSEFNKMLGYDKKNYLDLMKELEIYKDFNNLYKFKKFIINLRDDFRIENYHMREKVLYLLDKKKYTKKK